MSDDGIVYLHEWTNMDIPPSRVLEGAAGLCPVLVIGRDKDGGTHVASSSTDAWSNYTLLREALRVIEENAEPNWQEG